MKINISVIKKFRISGVLILLCMLSVILWARSYQQNKSLRSELQSWQQKYQANQADLDKTTNELTQLRNADQYLINQQLNQEMENIHKTYGSAVDVYENLLKLKEATTKTGALDQLFTQALTLLSEKNYSSAQAVLADLNQKIETEQQQIIASYQIPVNVPSSNSPPNSGYNRQQVSTDGGTFLVDIITADLNSTRVIVDTASDGDCTDNCPVMSLASYAQRNGAYAGVNGSYFCPAAYPSCVGKTNSFDTLAMNKNKIYLNSANNVYSDVPAVIFGNGWIRFVGTSKEWGRDTGVDGVLANQPLLVSAGFVSFGGDDDPKKGSRGNRSFVANKGNLVYIGVVHNATVAESGRILKAMGADNALNLDDGGSTALWFGGYKVGPGRDLPNVILFIRK